MREPLAVTEPEAGQKLLQLLTRRFGLPSGVLHRWIRTGQVRINGRRAGAFDRVAAGDLIRVPPFAADAAAETRRGRPGHEAGGALPPVVAETEDVLVFNKPAGLPVHPGSGHRDSLAGRLARLHADMPFCPTPAHRLDKDTSGLLLVAKTHTALRRMCAAFAAGEGLVREYLAWVAGKCPWDRPRVLRDHLGKGIPDSDRRKEGNTVRERVLVRDECTLRKGDRLAVLVARCVDQNSGSSLMHVRLHTGRTHQIRAQMAAHGFPLIGDVKYRGPVCSTGLKLHAFRLGMEGTIWTVLPPWDGIWTVRQAPAPLPDSIRL